MEDLDQNFFQKFNKGDIIVAGKNFGCGSSREQAVICLKYIGLSAIIAKSFARIFFRNAINQGLPIIEFPNAVDEFENGDELMIDIKIAQIKNLNNNQIYYFKLLPEFLQDIVKAGGLIPWLSKNSIL